MSARLALLLLFLLIVPLSGCFASEEGPRLAQPTDTPAVLPNRPNMTQAGQPGAANATGTAGNPTLDYDDPGFVVEGTWQVGDTWYYEANVTPFSYRHVEVRGRAMVGDRETLVVEELRGVRGQPPETRLTFWVDAETGARIRAEEASGTRILFTPGDMSHWLYRNATAAWNETGRDARGFAWRDQHTLASSYAGIEQVSLPWGTVRAGRVEHRDLVTDADGQSTTIAVTRWISSEWKYDVQYGTPERSFLLMGARVGAREVGTIVTPP